MTMMTIYTSHLKECEEIRSPGMTTCRRCVRSRIAAARCGSSISNVADVQISVKHAQLLATSLDRGIAHLPHPAFVEIIRQIVK
jgi:hypothetical protein